jgi:hypothetical protein
MVRPKKIIDPIAISVTVSKKFSEHLKRAVLRSATQEGRMITISEAIRALLEHVYPMNETMDLFENTKGTKKCIPNKKKGPS